MIRQHPAFALLILFCILGITLLLVSHVIPAPEPLLGFDFDVGDRLPTLKERLISSESIFQRTIERRHDLITVFGPRKEQVKPFPKDPPYPPYTLWDFFPASFACPWEVERIGGMGDGGKFACGLSRLQRKQDCVIYSFGINTDSSFEAEALERTQHCEVWGYDFSVDKFGPQLRNRPDLASRGHFFPYGLSGRDAHAPEDKPPMYRLETLMQMNGHFFIDILKIDIEMHEFGVMTDILQSFRNQPLPFGQLHIEIHAWHKNFPEFLGWWEAMEDAGLRPYATEPNLVYVNYARSAPELSEYSFINIRGKHELIGDTPFE